VNRTPAPAAASRVERPRGPVARVLGGLARLLSMLVVALLCSILLEWFGMVVWWPDQGVHHSERMLAQELRYLNQGFARSVIVSEPSRLARGAADGVRDALESLGYGRLIAGIRSPRSEGPWRQAFGSVLADVTPYLEAAAITAQTVAVRIVVIALATPVFVLFGLVGLAEGLTRRDLRRWGGGRESSFLYHHSKRLLGPSMFTAWMLYLAVPFSIHPALVFLPFAIAWAIGIAVTTGAFKKYL